MRSARTIPSILILALLAGVGAATGQEPEREFTTDFPLESCRFVPWGGNEYFSLQPGRQLILNNASCVADGECDALEEVRITVLDKTRVIPFVIDGKRHKIRTRVVEEYETENGEVKEISRNFFATCLPDRDVYYFGEEVFDGEGQPLPDAWLAGRNGAEPGIIMPDSGFILGQRYYQELAPGVALDRAEHVGSDIEVETEEFEFDDCVRVRETTPLQPDSESFKIYCPGVGLAMDDELELASFNGPIDDDDDGDDD